MNDKKQLQKQFKVINKKSMHVLRGLMHRTKFNNLREHQEHVMFLNHITDDGELEPRIMILIYTDEPQRSRFKEEIRAMFQELKL